MVIHYVYELYTVDSGEVVYIGRSVAPKTRLAVFRRMHPDVSVLQRIAFAGSLADCQAEERSRIKSASPMYNKYVSSSPCRVGKKWSEEAKQHMRESMSGRTLSEEHRKKLWAERDRAPLVERNKNKVWTRELKKETAERTRLQFEDSSKRERHRIACLANIERRRAAGLPFGRACKK